MPCCHGVRAGERGGGGARQRDGSVGVQRHGDRGAGLHVFRRGSGDVDRVTDLVGAVGRGGREGGDRRGDRIEGERRVAGKCRLWIAGRIALHSRHRDQTIPERATVFDGQFDGLGSPRSDEVLDDGIRPTGKRNRDRRAGLTGDGDDTGRLNRLGGAGSIRNIRAERERWCVGHQRIERKRKRRGRRQVAESVGPCRRHRDGAAAERLGLALYEHDILRGTCADDRLRQRFVTVGEGDRDRKRSRSRDAHDTVRLNGLDEADRRGDPGPENHGRSGKRHGRQRGVVAYLGRKHLVLCSHAELVDLSVGEAVDGRATRRRDPVVEQRPCRVARQFVFNHVIDDRGSPGHRWHRPGELHLPVAERAVHCQPSRCSRQVLEHDEERRGTVALVRQDRITGEVGDHVRRDTIQRRLLHGNPVGAEGEDRRGSEDDPVRRIEVIEGVVRPSDEQCAVPPYIERPRHHRRRVDADPVIVKLQFDRRDTAGISLQEPHTIRGGILVGRSVVERHRERGEGLHEVGAIDRTAILEHVAAEAGRIRLGGIVAPQLPVEIAVRSDDRGIGNSQRLLHRDRRRPVGKRVDAAVDRRRSRPQVVIAGGGVDERIGIESQRLAFCEAGNLRRGVPVGRGAHHCVGLARGIHANAQRKVREQVVEQGGAGVFVHHDSRSRRILRSDDRVVDDSTEGHGRNRHDARVGVAAEADARRAACGDNVVRDDDARNEPRRVRSGRVEHDAGGRGVRGPITARIDADSIGLGIGDEVAVDDELPLLTEMVRITKQPVRARQDGIGVERA